MTAQPNLDENCVDLYTNLKDLTHVLVKVHDNLLGHSILLDRDLCGLAGITPRLALDGPVHRSTALD